MSPCTISHFKTDNINFLPAILSSADFFLKQLQNQLLGKILSAITSLDPDQARRIVGPDLDPNCLQMLSAYDTCRENVKVTSEEMGLRFQLKTFAFFILDTDIQVLW